MTWNPRSTGRPSCHVVRARPPDDLVGRGSARPALRPFLEGGLGVAKRPFPIGHPHPPLRGDEAAGDGDAAIEVKRADHRLADVTENRRLAAPARLRLAAAEPDHRAEIEVAGNRRAGLVADQRGQPAGQFALRRGRKKVDQHLGDDQPQHAVAEKFEPLIGRATGFHGAGMGQRGLEQAAVGESMAEALFKRREAGVVAARHSTPVIGRS